MKNALTVALLAGAATAGAAAQAQQPGPLAGADPNAGKPIAEKSCVTCHARRFGDAATIYTRSDRRVNTPAQLLAQVRYCNTELKAGLFPEDEANVAAYLNEQYYKFK